MSRKQIIEETIRQYGVTDHNQVETEVMNQLDSMAETKNRSEEDTRRELRFKLSLLRQRLHLPDEDDTEDDVVGLQVKWLKLQQQVDQQRFADHITQLSQQMSDLWRTSDLVPPCLQPVEPPTSYETEADYRTRHREAVSQIMTPLNQVYETSSERPLMSTLAAFLVAVSRKHTQPLYDPQVHGADLVCEGCHEPFRRRQRVFLRRNGQKTHVDCSVDAEEET